MEEKSRKTYKKALILFLSMSIVALVLSISGMKDENEESISRNRSTKTDFTVTIGDESFDTSLFVKKTGEKEFSLQPSEEGRTLKDEFEGFLRREERTSRDEEKFVLPTTFNGEKITYKRKMSNTPLIMVVLGLIGGGLVVLNEVEKEKANKKRREEEYSKTYPRFVYVFATLFCSGMSPANVVDCMLSEKLFQDSPIDSLLLRFRTRVQSGEGIGEAFRKMGDETGIKEYRKFSSLLMQNREKGSDGLKEMLISEVVDAENESLNRAREDAEKMGGKLLITITGLLFVVIVILIGPAYMTLCGINGG